MAHVDAGKTTCAERILFLAGRIRAKGEVHDGNTRLDFHPLERKKGITIQAAATSVPWRPSSGLFAGQDHVVSLVDTPGHVDFTIEVERSLRVLDGAVFVLDGASGVECQSETVFRQASHHKVPCIAFVNKMDKPGADFDACLRDIEEKLGVTAVPVQAPWTTPSGLAVLDVLGELASRRAIVRDVIPRLERGLVTVAARLPVASTFDFVPRLRALSHGRGEALVRPDGYDVAPAEVANALIER
jgi:elongation factor G